MAIVMLSVSTQRAMPIALIDQPPDQIGITLDLCNIPIAMAHGTLRAAEGLANLLRKIGNAQLSHRAPDFMQRKHFGNLARRSYSS
jgi:hypothetical protein